MRYGRWTLAIVGVIVLSISAWAIAQQNGKAHKRLGALEMLAKAVDLTQDQKDQLKTPAENLDKARADWKDAVEKVLTPEQKEKLKSKWQNRRHHKEGHEGAPDKDQGKDKDDDN